mgnify:CR=1 FL=1
MSFARLKQAIRSRLEEEGGFGRAVGTLVGGTAFAQAVMVLALPVLTRLYTPEQFSVLAVYVSLLGMLSVIACLRFEIAIPLPERDEDAANLLVLAIGSGLILSLLTGGLVFLHGGGLANRFGISELSPYLWMVPVGMWMASAYAATQYWATRKKNFRRIARTRMAQATGGVGVQVGAGLLGTGSIGLLAGHMISSGAGFLSLGLQFWRQDRRLLKRVNLQSLRKVAIKYERFPKYATFEAFANSAGSQLPVILIAVLAIGPEAGFLLLATRVMAAPMALVGSSYAQAYLAHAPTHLRDGRLGSFTENVFEGLLKIGVGPLLFMGIVATPVISIVFGKEWLRTGELIMWLTPWCVLKFLSSPVSMVMHVKQQQSLMLLMQLLGLAMRLLAIWLAFKFASPYMAESFAMAAALFYGLCCFVYYRLAGVGVGQAFSVLSRCAVVLLGWVLAGLTLRYFIGAI